MTITGTSGNDTLMGTSGADLIEGLAGDDSLQGGLGNDTIQGGAGDDTLEGDAGNDSLEGGAGDNELYGGEGNDTLVTNWGYADGGNDTDLLIADFSGFAEGVHDYGSYFYRYDLGQYFYYSNIELFNITGTDYDDTLRAYSFDDTIDGGAGNDLLHLNLSDETNDLNIVGDFSNSTNQVIVNGTAWSNISNFESFAWI